eukprot:4039432-Alexandrium_andersonii.AAC.1
MDTGIRTTALGQQHLDNSALSRYKQLYGFLRGYRPPGPPKEPLAQGTGCVFGAGPGGGSRPREGAGSC